MIVRSAAVGLTLLLVACPTAWAIDPPVVDASAQAPAGSTGPAVPMTQRAQCITTGVLPGTLASPETTAAPAQSMLNLAGAWRFSRGEGQTVAVIDTGVTPGPRLPNVQAGGDYVGSTDGLTDCDGHGTLVAGIIAGQPGDDAFSGVAPAARVLAIRQTSAAYSPRTPAVDLASLARAVVHAADLGARVINISPVTCQAADNTVDQSTLGAALRYAAVEKDAVVVAAAGNTSATELNGGTACESNPGGWADVTSVSSPSWWQPYVLSVGSVTATGQPSASTMAGPWLGIAAPGENIVSLSNGDGGGLANGTPDGRGDLTSLDGTSFAAAYVSGVAALVRSRYPELTAAQVITRLITSAHRGARTPSNLVGAGVVDPVGALTWQLPASAEPETVPATHIAAPLTPPSENHRPRNVALVGTAALGAAVAAAAFAAHRRKDQAQ